ncbi:MAG: hypothetical protein IH861_14980 [Chloroflexi bacterium]|nr:hypothetical protein [Chloroflexota bacterium]
MNEDSVVLYDSFSDFAERFLLPKLNALEEVRSQLESGKIDLMSIASSDVDVALNEYALSTELDPHDFGVPDAFYVEPDVVEDIGIYEISGATALPGGDIFVESTWSGQLSVIAHLPGYQTEYSERRIEATIHLVLDWETFENKGLDVVSIEIQEPLY